MDKYTPPISTPERFGVSNQEVADLALKLREGLSTQNNVSGEHRHEQEALGEHAPAPRVVVW